MSDKPLVKGKLYVQKYRRKWQVVRFVDWDKMEAEYKILSEHDTEGEANLARARLGKQAKP